MHGIHVKVDDVKISRAPENLLQLPYVKGDRLGIARIQAQRVLAHRDVLRRGMGIAAREQRDLMALRHKLLGQVGHHSFGAAIEHRGHAFIKGCDLRDS